MTPRAAAKVRRAHALEVYRIGHRSAGTGIAEHAYGSTLARRPLAYGGPRRHPPARDLCSFEPGAGAARKRVHANGVQPVDQASCVLTLPSGVAVPYAHERGLPAHWKNELSITQAFGDAWLDAGDELALCVPSIVEPAEQNLLLNANHPHIERVTVRVERDPFEFDPRLM